ncbi:nitroreductase family deazaflavin-dependent oxidoreductase [Microbacterium halophytorum]|uniref:nitroreductase family deazaflavin-dependent oxidoreductase n=1 Tax=Microbacterium halophytorum TaxID=2067568 RepID=UPI000CFDC164|nr:nitroreductase family deazaflavin-dependent oxidoreductase [Microbacterium halophytorum]
MIDSLIARLLGTRWLMRLPIGIYRAGFGWMLGDRLVMIEHQGRVSGERRYVVVEVAERTGSALRVASGFGEKSQWYRNLRANGVAYLSTGRVRRRRVDVNLLDHDASRVVLERYAAAHPAAWERLSAAMEIAQGHDPVIPIVEFRPFG